MRVLSSQEASRTLRRIKRIYTAAPGAPWETSGGATEAHGSREDVSLFCSPSPFRKLESKTSPAILCLAPASLRRTNTSRPSHSRWSPPWARSAQGRRRCDRGMRSAGEAQMRPGHAQCGRSTGETRACAVQARRRCDPGMRSAGEAQVRPGRAQRRRGAGVTQACAVRVRRR